LLSFSRFLSKTQDSYNFCHSTRPPASVSLKLVVISDAASGVLPEPTEGTQQSAGKNPTAALPRRPVSCDEGQSHDRNLFSPRVF